jgi:hypothetical protein
MVLRDAVALAAVTSMHDCLVAAVVVLVVVLTKSIDAMGCLTTSVCLLVSLHHRNPMMECWATNQTLTVWRPRVAAKTNQVKGIYHELKKRRNFALPLFCQKVLIFFPFFTV